MEDCVDHNFQSSSLILNIKKEPKDEEDGHYNLETRQPDYHVTKSLVLRFKRDKTGGYSVVPFIKPDPFFEENLEDLCCEESLVKIKSEDDLNHVNDETVDIKQETIDNDRTYSTDETVDTRTEKRIKENDKAKENSSTVRCPTCFYTNTKKLVQRHRQRVHVSITKHSCPFCDKKNFKEPLSLDYHILRNHRDVRGAIDRIRRTIFECTFCSYKTLKRNNFRRHLTTHGETRLKKHLDVKGENGSLVGLHSKREMKRALSTVKYDCFHCPYTTKDKGSIIKHSRLHRESGQLPFCCKACSKKFNEKNSLDSHIVKRHIDNTELLQLITNRVYECEMCDYKDVNKNKVIRHKRARHVKKERKRRKIGGKVKLKVVKK